MKFFLKLTCLLVACFLAPAAFAESKPITDAEIVHLLNRVSFGPSPGDIENVRRLGWEKYIDQQLNPDQLSAPELQERLKNLPTLNASMADLAIGYKTPFQELPPDEQKLFNTKQNVIVEELSEAKILRAIMSPAQLQEVMADFWFNHFNVFAKKGADKLFIGAYDRDAIRPYALGHFRSLLEATAHHPAMLVYLDNWLNVDPESVAGQRAAMRQNKKIGINENYAREIMELHTLGVDGGYTQADVTTLAHILTGWGLTEGRSPEDKADFYFDPRRHDFTDKVWLGYHIKGSGEDEIEQVLDILAYHPSTAHHIAYELAQYFVADDPPQSLVDKLTAIFQSSKGDIKAVLDTLFHSEEFWDPKYMQQKFKPPFRYVVSAFRASGATPEGDTRMLQGALKQMGEPLYHCLTPNGYSNTNDQWLNSDALLKRIDFAQKLSRVLDDPSQIILNSMGKTWSENTLKTAGEAKSKVESALLLSSPEFVHN